MLLRPTLLRRALVCAPLLAMGSCATDERELVFGSVQGVGSASNLTSAGSHDPGGFGEGGQTPSDAGASSSGAGSTDTGGVGGTMPQTAGGSPESEGGAPSANGGTGGSGNSAGSSPQAGGGTGGSAGATGGGNGGVGGMGGTLNQADDGPCGDLDTDGVQDCDQTIAQNPRFDQDAKDWLADPGVTSAWQADDARAKAGSGSLKVTFTTGGASNGWALGATGQCLPAWTDEVYEVAARARVATGQAGGQAQLTLAFFGNDGCADSFLSGKSIESTEQPGTWQPLRGAVKAPAGTRSVLVRLAAAKLGSQKSLEVHFDDVLFRKK